MADLDDFFAKKDKKKGKTKKFLSSEELVKQLEQSAKEKALEKELSKKPAKIDEDPEITKQEKDEEWNEFEEEKRPDLSNLKLGQLNIDGNNENNQNFGGNDYENENSQNEGDSSENPWNKANSATAAPAPAAAKVPEQAKQQSKAAGIYVPPSMLRNENAMKARVNRKNAPDLQNEEFFPSLGTEKPAEPIRPNKGSLQGFEEVKHGGKLTASATAGPASVSLGNAYASLLSESLDS